MTQDTGPELKARTERALAELRSLLAELTQDDLSRVVDGGWTVSAVLAHLAFWDRWVENRWRLFEANGAFDDLPDNIADLINATAEPQWMVLPPSQARQLAEAAAESLNKTIQNLEATAVAAAIATHRQHMLDRSRHWGSHIADVRRLLS